MGVSLRQAWWLQVDLLSSARCLHNFINNISESPRGFRRL
jgi:hypothetical protein